MTTFSLLAIIYGAFLFTYNNIIYIVCVCFVAGHFFCCHCILDVWHLCIERFAIVFGRNYHPQGAKLSLGLIIYIGSVCSVAGHFLLPLYIGHFGICALSILALYFGVFITHSEKIFHWWLIVYIGRGCIDYLAFLAIVYGAICAFTLRFNVLLLLS